MKRSGIAWLIGLLAALTSVSAPAQVLLAGTDNLDFDRPEAWAMKYFASLNLLTGFGPPQDLSPGSVVVGFEVDSVPSLDETQRRVGFNGTKNEDMIDIESWMPGRGENGPDGAPLGEFGIMRHENHIAPFIGTLAKQFEDHVSELVIKSTRGFVEDEHWPLDL